MKYTDIMLRLLIDLILGLLLLLLLMMMMLMMMEGP